MLSCCFFPMQNLEGQGNLPWNRKKTLYVLHSVPAVSQTSVV